MHIIWVYIFTFFGTLLFFYFIAYIKNIEASLIFKNKIFWIFFLTCPFLYIYSLWRYPDGGYEVVLKMSPLGTGFGMLLVSIPLLTGWFRWDPKYSEIMPLVAAIYHDKKWQYFYLKFGTVLVLIYIMLDLFFY